MGTRARAEEGKIDVFAFVLMPNHIHLIWRTKELNGKESAQGSFLKFTAHTFKKLLKGRQPDLLIQFRVEAGNKKFEFWQRDSLAVHLYTKEVALQKLEYIHNNPVKAGLVHKAEEYVYSSAADYAFGKQLLSK